METKKIEDYHFAKEELRMRLQLMYTQNMGVIPAALALWTISIAAMKLLPDHEIGNSALSILIYMIFAIPAFIALPLSVKSGDNLSRVAQLAAYIRVFHELKAVAAGGGEFPLYESAFKASGQMQGTEKKSDILFFWLFNCEFIVIALISLLLVCGYLIYNIVIKAHIMLIVAGSVFLAVLVAILILVWINANGKRKFYEVMIKSEEDFIAIAKKMGVITEDDEMKYKEIMKNMGQ